MADAIVRSSSIRPDSIVNDVVVTIAPNPDVPVPDAQSANDTISQDNYGIQSIAIIDSLLSTEEQAQELAEYLLRPEPNFWYTGLGLDMGALSSVQRNVIATLDIGTLVAVTKSYKYGTPSTVTKRLYVEGIEHSITTNGHKVKLYFSPVGFSQAWNGIDPNLAWEDVASGLTWGNVIWNNL